MLLRKQGLHVAEIAAADDPRYGINGVRVLADGSTVATDGHALAHYQPAELAPAEEYPALPGCNPASPGELEPFTLPADAAKRILRAVPKGRGVLPVLADNVALDVAQTNANGCAVLGVTDLEAPQVFRPGKVEGNFPLWEKVVPARDRYAPVAGIGVKLLIRVLRMFDRMGVECIRVQLAPEKPGEKPVRIDGLPESKNARVTAVVMPHVLSDDLK